MGFERFVSLFEENEIDADVLPDLTEEHLKELGIGLGPRVKLLKRCHRAGSVTPSR